MSQRAAALDRQATAYENDLKDQETFGYWNMGVGVALAGLNLWAQFDLNDVQREFNNAIYGPDGIIDKRMTLEGDLAEIQRQIMEDRNLTLKDIARIQAGVEEHRIDKESETTVKSAEIGARYRALDRQFYSYGTPA
jgi:hypothetical protein